MVLPSLAASGWLRFETRIRAFLVLLIGFCSVRGTKGLVFEDLLGGGEGLPSGHATTSRNPTPPPKPPNPYERGCLHAKNITNKIRVCNSDDDDESSIFCRKPLMEYPEIRLIPQDWESVMFSSWILQILLSEVLDVPTTLEMGSPSAHLNFYHPDSPFDYPVTANWMTALEKNSLVDGDCSKAKNTAESHYLECGHFVPEVWGGRKRDVQNMVQRDVIEPPLNVGQLAEEGWFIPKHTALRDPTLLSYLGYQGEENRQKMAERFLRPTTWKDYCEEVSPDKCFSPDGVAQRAPKGEGEHDKMFAEGLYTGHFRATDSNNCTVNPHTCTGHFVDYPCDWRSPVPGQLHHLGVALKTDVDDPLDPYWGHGGYSYSQLTEIWRAANATKSDVIMMWWRPQLLTSQFQGTDFEFTRVTLPPATQTCIEARVDTMWHCSPNLQMRVGKPEGTCMEPPNSLYSIMSTSVYNDAYGSASARKSNKVEAEFSPSHEALTNYRLSELQIEEILLSWNQLGDPRRAVCGWVSDNLEWLESFIPREFPRSFEHKDDKGPLLYVSTFIGAICMVGVFITFVAVHQYKHLRAIQHAQVEFLHLLLLGALLISLGAIVMGSPATNATCITEVWLINIGYTLELVPLIVKIGAVLHVMDSGKKMKRVKIDRRMLFGAVALICVGMIIYLIIWTALDPPLVSAEYEVTGQQNEFGETIVWVKNVCRSESDTWHYISVGWNAFLLLVTTVLAIRMRKLNVKGFQETPTLALLVYSHFFFVILRVLTYIFSVNGGLYNVHYYQSIIFSADTMATIAIYFVPKFLAEELGSSRRLSISGINVNAVDPSAMDFSRNSVRSFEPRTVRFQMPGESALSGLSAASGTSGSEEPCWREEQEERGNNNVSEGMTLLKKKIKELQQRNGVLEEENKKKSFRLISLEEEIALLRKDCDNECEKDIEKDCESEYGEEKRS